MNFKPPAKPEDLLQLAGPIVGVIVLLLALIGVGVGSSGGTDGAAPTTSAKPSTSAQPTPTPTTTAAPSGKFENNLLDSLDYRFEITEARVVPAGGRDNRFGEAAIVFTYEFTNKRAREIGTIEAWVNTFSAKQEDENVRHDLKIAPLYTGKLANDITVKPNGKVTAQFAYELKDEELPVTLSAQTGLVRKSGAGKQTYPVK